MAIEIRAFQKTDEEKILQIGADQFRSINIPYILEDEFSVPGFGAALNRFWTEWLYSYWPEDFLVAAAEGHPVGFAALLIEEEIAMGTLWLLAVEASFQGKGIGTNLCEKTFQHFAAREVRIASTGYDYQNKRVERLYQKLGFTPLEKIDYYAKAVKNQPLENNAGERVERVAVADLDKFMDAVGEDRLEFLMEKSLNKKHHLGVDLWQAVQTHLSEELGRATRIYVAFRDGRLTGFLVSDDKPDQRVVEITRLIARDSDVGLSLLYRLAEDLKNSPAQVIYIAINSEDQITERILQSAHFRWVHTLIRISMEMS